MNRQVLLAARPRGLPQPSDFDLVERPLPQPQEGEFLVRTLYLSVDPYMRGRMNDVASYVAPIGLGEVMVGECVAEVIESRHPKFPEGTFVAGLFGWQEYAVSDGQGVRRLSADGPPLTTALHVLGMPGLTAYFGITDICSVQRHETVVVSGAAGAVGSIAAQLAKRKECRVVGIAGSDEKVRYLTDELGLDAAFNYKTVSDYASTLRGFCPLGIDAYYDNVGGPITDAVFPLLNVHARVAICGQIASYNAERPEQGPRLLWHLIVKRATVRGFLITDYVGRFREGLQQLGELYHQDQLHCRERITLGIENAPQAFIEMLQGANIGKQLVKIGAP